MSYPIRGGSRGGQVNITIQIKLIILNDILLILYDLFIIYFKFLYINKNFVYVI